nr:hypothetical protein [Tanacetum cinerariifolium]
MPPRRRNRVNNEAGPIFTAAVAQAVADLLPTLTARITDKIRQNKNNRNNASTPVEAENWIAHIEKIFEVLGCGDQFKARLEGFLGAKAGNQEEQAKHFKWGLNDFLLDKILNTEFTDVAQVANAARNIEIFRDRPKNEGDNKRDRDGHRIRPSETPSQGSDPRADDRRDSDRYGNRGRHRNRDRYGTDRWRGKACHRATGACFECGEVVHLAKDCKKGSTSNEEK